jgi:hypothetical protein
MMDVFRKRGRRARMMGAGSLALAALCVAGCEENIVESTRPSECTADVYGRTANGSSMWVAANQGVTGDALDSNCMLNQYAVNNFMYLVGDDGSGHPRFMGYTAWYDLFPASGSPVQATGYNSLNGTQLNKSDNQEEAGDGFELLDVGGVMTSYDIRVNGAFFDYVNTNNLYTKTALKAQETAFQANSKTGGIWLPAGDGSTNEGAIEIKTAWRNYSSTAGTCPSDIMHCETDEDGTEWGLVGFHLVQKSVDQTAFVWSTFEHVGNAPDCLSRNSNPIAQNPVDPTTSGSTINVNKNITALKDVTGWSYFDYERYLKDVKASGILMDNNCPYPTKTTESDPLCLTSPVDGSGWQQVNVCRVQALPVTDACKNSMTDPTNLSTIACLNQSVQQNFPSTLASKWKYYELVGMEWMFDGSTGDGAMTTGCFTYDEADGANACPNYPHKGGGELGIPNYSRDGSTQMANTTMETWTQADMFLEYAPGKTVSAADCFACHQPQTTSYQGDMSHLFGRIQQD